MFLCCKSKGLWYSKKCPNRSFRLSMFLISALKTPTMTIRINF